MNQKWFKSDPKVVPFFSEQCFNLKLLQKSQIKLFNSIYPLKYTFTKVNISIVISAKQKKLNFCDTKSDLTFYIKNY